MAQPGAYRVRVLNDSTYTITYARDGPGSPLDDWTVYGSPRDCVETLGRAAAIAAAAC